MTARELLKNAANVMGFNAPTDEMLEFGITAMNSSLEDLNKAPIETLEATIENITEAEKQALIYGTALFLSVAMGDLRSNECFSPIYHKKRRKAKGEKTFVLDSLPKGELI